MNTRNNIPVEEISEFDARPNQILIFNPIAHGAIHNIQNTQSTSELKNKYLFREKPNTLDFCSHHLQFGQMLQDILDNNVVLIDQVLNGELEKYSPLLQNNPNQIYTRDSAITFPWLQDKYILGNMKKDIRKKEPIIMERVMTKLRLEKLFDIPNQLTIEGGDVIPFSYDGKRVLLIGYGTRTDYKTIEFLRESMINNNLLDEIIAIEISQKRINLDGCFMPISDNVVVTHKESLLQSELISKHSKKNIDIISFFQNTLKYNIVEVNERNSIYSQACNILTLGHNEVIMYDLAPEITKQLEDFGIKVHLCIGKELVKGTGGPRCMSRPIYKW